MATEIKIHRGNQIGGCVTELWTEHTRILIDFGEELPGSKHESPLELDWGPSADGSKPAVSAVFFTHYHGDHIGRFQEAYQHAHLYMSELSREVLVNIHGYLEKNLPKVAEYDQENEEQILWDAEKHRAALEILMDGNRVHTFRPHEKTVIPLGDIQITPFWVDHSAGDACMFLVETEDKTILHTGDFRGHGAQGEDGAVMCKEISRLAAEKQINVLITEGTMMSRRDEKPYSEQQLLETAKQFFREHRHVFLIISSTNLDSISTFYQAAQANQIPMYCHNPYVEGQIKTLGAYARQHWGMPDMADVERVKLWSAEQQEGMREKGFIAIIKANETGEALVRRFRDCNPVIVYSMWQGYVWRKLDPALCGFLERCQGEGIPVFPPNTLDKKASSIPRMHTSGHASPELIAEVIRAANPEELFPIHTEDAWEFLQLDIPETLKEKLQDRMIKAGEASGYAPEDDHRSLNPAALDKFMPEGSHRVFVKLVQKYPKELAFCFRGNSDDAAVIYYKNHAAFHITKSGYVRFNFDHARYLENWETYRDTLREQFGYRFPEKREAPQKKRNSYSIGTISMPKEDAQSLTLKRLKKLYTNNIRPIIKSFFDASQNEAVDQFRRQATKEERGTDRELTEKAVQQKLFLACRELSDGYFFYDLEFSQPYGRLLGCKNQPDMMAIHFDANGKPKRLVFVEVKSTPKALGGTSGLKPHVQGMERYPGQLLPARRKDACNILNQYIALGLITGRSEPFDLSDFEQLPIEIMLIFTGTDTIDALKETKTDREGRETIEMFLSNQGYTVEDDIIPCPSGIEAMKVYRKDLSHRFSA